MTNSSIDSQADAHKELVNAFRKELFDEGILKEGDSIGTDDITMERFLRARKYDLKKSKDMFRKCQEWRKTAEGVGIDELYKQMDPFDYPERKVVFDYWPMWFHKTDKKGRPLNFEFLGSLDLNRLYKECSPERHWQSILVTTESLPREIIPSAARRHNKPVNSVFVIIDLKGFGLGQFWQMKNLAQKSFQISQDYYPETMGQLAIINAPSSFTFIWSAVKPWLAQETVEKIEILGSDYKERLLELIDADSLPSILGGNCTCEEFGGCHLSGAGPWLEGRNGWGPNSVINNDTKLDNKTADSEVQEERKKEQPKLEQIDDKEVTP